MPNTKSYSLRTLLAAVLVLKEHPKALECIEFVNDFINNIYNDDIFRGCSVSWDDTNNGFFCCGMKFCLNISFMQIF